MHRPRLRDTAVVLVTLLVAWCESRAGEVSRSGRSRPGSIGGTPGPSRAAGPGPERGPGPATATRDAQASRPAAPRALVTLYEDGRAREVETAWALEQGYAILDLSDDWVPQPFTEAPPDGGAPRPNSYRLRYLDLADDRTDHRGAPLAPGRANHLELYGITPTLSALARRARLDEEKAGCHAAVDRESLRALDRSIHYASAPAASRRLLREADQWEGERSRLFRLRGWKDEAEAEARAKGVDRATLRAHRVARIRRDAVRAAQARLACEGLVRAEEPITGGVVDWNHHLAIVRFERKHMIFGWGQLWGETRDAMLRSTRENNMRTLHRVLRERAANQLGVIEDGSVPTTLGQEAGAQDRVGRLAQAAAEALGVTDADRAHAFLVDRPDGWFARRLVALRLPSPPPYHGTHMDLRAVIDRGDVWYDFPYDEAGRPVAQPIARRPRLTLYARHEGRLLPLVRWSTTIGGWRTEVHRGCPFWKYKESDVGDRLWKYLVAAPVWLPPPGTPPRSLVIQRLDRGRVELVPKDGEIGPGHQSAYGLVAALHTREVRRRGQVEDGDDGIRTHGSADYMSILTSHSHGCHRLHNHLAVRLASFLLHHRRSVRLGEQPVRWRYGFEYQGRRFAFERDHKGYYFQLDPPVPVTVTRGNILGKARQAVPGYVRKRDPNVAQDQCPETPGGQADTAAPAATP